jgi:hypothetical protein
LNKLVSQSGKLRRASNKSYSMPLSLKDWSKQLFLSWIITVSKSSEKLSLRLIELNNNNIFVKFRLIVNAFLCKCAIKGQILGKLKVWRGWFISKFSMEWRLKLKLCKICLYKLWLAIVKKIFLFVFNLLRNFLQNLFLITLETN